MQKLTRTAAGIALAASTILGAAPAFAQQPAAPAGRGMQGMHRGMQGMHRGMQGRQGGMFQRIAQIDFTAAGVTKPVFWDALVAWAKTDDAAKVAATMTHPAVRPATPPDHGAMLAQVDFQKAGVTKPVFWDALVAWAKTDDAAKVLPPRGMGRGAGMMGAGLVQADFEKAGVAKPAFWDQLVTWLKSEDATKLHSFMQQQHRGARAAAPQE